MFWRYWIAVLMVVYLNFWFVSRTSVDEIGQYKVSASTCIWYPFLLKKKFFSFEVDLQFCSSFVYFFYDMFIFCPNYVNPPIFPPFIFHYYFKVSACKILIFFVCIIMIWYLLALNSMLDTYTFRSGFEVIDNI